METIEGLAVLVGVLVYWLVGFAIASWHERQSDHVSDIESMIISLAWPGLLIGAGIGWVVHRIRDR